MTSTTEQNNMTTITLQAGTLVRVCGIPVLLAADTLVETAEGNVELLAQELAGEPRLNTETSSSETTS